MQGFSAEFLTRSVSIDLIVDEYGRVESAQAAPGPSDIVEATEKLASERRYKPFVRDGLPVRASLQEWISLVPPEEWLEPAVAFPEVKSRSTLTM